MLEPLEILSKRALRRKALVVEQVDAVDKGRVSLDLQ